MLHYILQVVAFQLLFLVIYDAFLKRETFFTLNRIYLLLTATLSVVIPFIKIEKLKTIIAEDFVVSLPEIIIGSPSEKISTIDPQIAMQAGINLEPTPTSIWNVILISGMCVATLILLAKAIKLVRITSKSSRHWEDNVCIVTLLNSNKAFSFFNYIYLGEHIETQDKSSILKHEVVHVRQKHSLDLLLFEVLRIAFWFNPLVYMYQNRIAVLHEYIADSIVVKHYNKADYYDDLLTQVFETQQFSFVNPFFKQSLIKKRILMLNTSKSKDINRFKYLLLIPLIMSMLVYTSCSIFKKSADKTVVKTESKVVENEETPFGIVDQVPIYKSCEHLSTNEERKKCMSQSISMYVNKNFNTRIGDSLGLVGKQRMNVLFKIDKDGNVTGIRARAPLPELEEEAIRVIKSLPKFTPGKHNGKTVVVPYSLPIIFQIDGKPEDNNSPAPSDNDSINALKEKFQDAEEVPFMAIDKAPRSEDCKNEISEKETKACFKTFVSTYVNKNFNTDLASKLGLVGKQRINVIFKVDKNGNITGARARAPHTDLEAETLRVINSLPQFAPGEMNGKPVIVNYSLPILFQVARDVTKDKKN